MLIQIILQQDVYDSGGAADSSFVGDVLIALLGGILSIAGAYLLFRIQQNGEKRKEEEDIAKSRQAKLVFFAALVRRAINSAVNQAALIEVQRQSLNRDPLTFPLLGMNSWRDLERISRDLHLEEYLVSFVARFGANNQVSRDNSVREFQSIVQSCDFFFDTFTLLVQTTKNAQDSDYRRKLEIQSLNKNILRLLNIVPAILQQADSPFAPRFLQIRETYNARMGEDRTDLNLRKDHLWIPLSELTLEYLNGQNPPFNEIVELFFITNETIEILGNCLITSRQHSEHLAEVVQSASVGIAMLNENAARLLSILVE